MRGTSGYANETVSFVRKHHEEPFIGEIDHAKYGDHTFIDYSSLIGKEISTS